MEEQTASPHPETLEQPTPALLSDIFSFVEYIYATFGWYILGFIVLSLYLWSKIQPSYEAWRKKREEDEYAAQIHKNPDLFRARQEAIIAARQRMQEEHDRQAKIKAERAQELEEQKREEWIARQTGTGGRRLGNEPSKSCEAVPGPSKKKDSSFKPEYNPLMGAGSSSGYRPPKRGCPGGGCGKK
ncbi:selenoprotein S-like [Thrips palmi]|uniref:Selenoprotein S-like n=1 Tax=Thrips palmi TaxID=161013 RepID=A0A6P8Y5F6_THRPL|nr:selenoprotein S-like [Thrips palmi]